MDYLYEIFYKERDKNAYEAVYNGRYNNEFAIKTPLQIETKNKEKYNLFLNLTPSILHSLNNIRMNEDKLKSLGDNLPAVAKRRFFLDVIIDELKSSNDLEGVASTKKELFETSKKTAVKRNESRFGSMITEYMSLLDGHIEPPKSPQDIRNIYDLITAGEITEDELPDGEIFRKDAAIVTNDKSFDGSFIHQGVVPEAAIIQLISDLVHYMNEQSELTNIIKIAITHYYFGYIHPFYDGNGRTGRFISSLYMTENYYVLTSMAIARGCYRNRNRYLKAFDMTNNKISKGEMNYFVDTFLETIKIGQEDIIALLELKQGQINVARDIINADGRLDDDLQREIIFVLAQDYYFSIETGVTQQELQQILGVGYTKLVGFMDRLIELDIVKVIKLRPRTFMINADYMEL